MCFLCSYFPVFSMGAFLKSFCPPFCFPCSRNKFLSTFLFSLQSEQASRGNLGDDKKQPLVVLKELGKIWQKCGGPQKKKLTKSKLHKN